MNGVIHIISADAPAEMLANASTAAGDQDTIVSIGPTPRRWQFDRKTIHVHTPLGNAPLAGLQLRKLIAQAELIHAWSQTAASAAQWAATKKPIIFSLPHLRGPHQTDIAISGCFDGLWKLTVPTEAQRRMLITLGLSPKNVFALPPTASPHSDPQTARQETRAKLGLDEHHFLLAAPGDMARSKRHKHACWAQAMALILSDTTRLVFPGRGPKKRAIESFARSTGHHQEIFFTAGDMAPKDVLAASDAAIFLQRHDSGVGALANAMACGLPILATNRPEIEELAPSGTAALTSRPGDMRQATDNLLTLASDKNLQQKLGAQSALLAKKQFAPAITQAAQTSIYSSLLAGVS
jgi:hypothetical protein